MNIEHVRQWTRRLRSGDIDQTRGHLVDPTGPRPAMCCLGVGAQEAGIPFQVSDDGRHGFFPVGDGGRTNSLPPTEFHLWLGLNVPVSETYDVVVDWPEGMTVLCQEPDVPDGWYESPIDGDEVATCSGLNDSGFTFSQIADLIDYFGVRAETKP